MFGLSEEAMMKILKKNVPELLSTDVGYHALHTIIFPNIVELISANNEALLFELEKERTKE